MVSPRINGTGASISKRKGSNLSNLSVNSQASIRSSEDGVKDSSIVKVQRRLVFHQQHH
jgi:hypothetical protein